GTPQKRQDLISLSTLLGITGIIQDPVTHQPLSIIQQFQQKVALPQNRDAAGNLELKFRTSIDPGNGIFGTELAMDTIQDVKINLVGLSGSPTGYVTLIQSGTGRLRGEDGSLTQYDLQPKTALVAAAINADASILGSDSTVPASTDLFGRPVDDPSWTLLIDQADDPMNAALNLSQLQDIQIILDHQGITLPQSP
ncbi:MAG TPA: hypothetical protein VMB50_18420, partial [Myxococcales bacterium]|nr:hypothetical protein [Myxococcales bacterium]